MRRGSKKIGEKDAKSEKVGQIVKLRRYRNDYPNAEFNAGRMG